MTFTILLCMQSLLDGGTSPYDTPKKKPFKKHDHIQIIVKEKTKGVSKANLITDKRSRWETDFNDFIRFDKSAKGNRRLRSADLADSPQIDLDARFREDNVGGTTREFELTFTVTAVVVDVKPNGNLVVEAKRKRKVNNEVETIKLTGEVAPDSVNSNVVTSDKIAKLDITYDGSGSVGDVQKPGALGWLLRQLWPF